MSQIFDNSLFASLGQIGLESDIYAQNFNSEQIETMGESPYLNGRDAGIELCLTKKHKVQAIHLYSGKLEGFCRFAGPYPSGLSFTSSRAQIRAVLGEPFMSMEAGGAGITAIERSFDRYENEQFYIRFQYEVGDGAVRLITLGLA
jgi:hypothetical protein